MLSVNFSSDYSIREFFHKLAGINSNSTLTLPIIGAITYDHPSLRLGYICFFLVLILIGLINNIFSLVTFTRDRIRYTICGIYLIAYSVCSSMLMISILTNLITMFYYENYYFRLWACHGHPYLSSTMVYTTVLISAAIAVEQVLNQRFNFDKFRSRQPAIIISISLLIVVSICNLDKILTRRLITNHSGHYSCTYEEPFYQLVSQISISIYTIIPCLIHWICLILILSIKSRKKCLEKIFFYQASVIPSISISLCLLLNVVYRYSFQFYATNVSSQHIRVHVGFLCLFYIPQIFTYMIYVFPNNFYVKEFYQIWFYRKLCCCFYNRQRHVQEFVVIHKLWPRRTSLETIKTVVNLDDTCMDSEFYMK